MVKPRSGWSTSAGPGKQTDGTNGFGLFVQQGATVVLTNTGNSWSGGTITTGTLQIGNGGANGSLGTGAITDNGALTFNSSANFLVNDPISGTGALNQNGSGTTTLNGDVSCGGAITANSGTLVLAGNNSFANSLTINRPGSPVVRIAHDNALGATASGTFILGNNNGGGRLELSNNITVTEPLTIDGRQSPIADVSAVLNVQGNNTLSANVTMAVGGSELNFQSDTGTLTVAGNLINTLSGVRNLKLMGASDGVWSGVITNVTAVVKTNSGTWTLSGANTYSGSNVVAQGTLKVNNSSGSGTGSGTVTVVAGATLAGAGSISGTVNLSGAVKPGNSVGTLSTGPETWNSGGSYTAEVIDATNSPGVGFDSLNITGGIDLQATSGNKFTIALASLDGTGSPGAVTNFDNNTTYTWQLATTTGSVTNFDTSKFSVDTSSFSNDLAGGDFVLESGSLNLRFTNNHAPVALTFTNQRPRDVGLKISITNLLASLTSDADGDARTLTFAGNSTNNATITTNGTYIFYTNTNNLNDTFTYTVRDVRNYRAGDTVRTATATVFVEIVEVASSNSITGFTTLGAGTNQIGFAGIPGYEYVVQFATNLGSSPWFDLSTNTAGTNGLWTVIDDTATNDMRFYRSVYR